MLALIGYGLLGVVVAVGVVSLLVIVLPADHLGAAPRDVVPSGLPARPEIRGEDVARVRLPVTLRGYRMVDTDAILDRLAFELERRDQEIDNLRQRAGLPPKELVEDSVPASPSEPLDDRARDEVLLPVGAAAGDVGAAPGSFGTGDSSPPVASAPRLETAGDSATASPEPIGAASNGTARGATDDLGGTANGAARR